MYMFKVIPIIIFLVIPVIIFLVKKKKQTFKAVPRCWKLDIKKNVFIVFVQRLIT